MLGLAFVAAGVNHFAHPDVYIASKLPLSARGLLGGITSLLSDGPRLTLPVLLRPTRADLDQLYTFAERGKLRPVIERSFPLAQAAAAHRYLEQKSSSADPPGPVLLRID